MEGRKALFFLLLAIGLISGLVTAQDEERPVEVAAPEGGSEPGPEGAPEPAPEQVEIEEVPGHKSDDGQREEEDVASEPEPEQVSENEASSEPEPEQVSEDLKEETPSTEAGEVETRHDVGDEDKKEEDNNEVHLETPSGPIFGLKEDNEEGTRFFSFKGIPYAEPPLGRLRFRDPVPRGAWKDTLNATAYGPRCVQASFVPGQPVWGSEDCLTLNVFSPKIPSGSGRPLPRSGLLPVMVYIHGGGFTLGAGQDATPDLFMNKEVLLVNLNYRLGALGFLSMGNRYIPGNQGLKDQLLALQWIASNIHAFGGDSRKVTLFGESVGGVSAALLMASPKGRGLYRNVIAMSGSALYRPYYYTNGVAYSEGRRFINEVGCENELLGDVLECLEGKKTEELSYFQASSNFTTVRGMDQAGSGFYKWVPTVDTHSVDPLLPRSPLELISSGQQKDIPMIIGFVANEGGFQGDPLFDQVDEINDNWDFHGPSNIFVVEDKQITEKQKLVSATAQQFYNGRTQNFTEDNKFGLFDMFSDSYFLSSGHKSAKLQSRLQKSPLYMYQITEKTSASIGSLYFPGTDIGDNGPTHADDLFFMFKSVGGLNGLETEAAKQASEKLLTLWTNFAKYNDPTPFKSEELPTWKTFDTAEENYLELKAEPEMRKGFEPVRMFFWEKLFWEPLMKAMAEHQITLPFIPGF